MYMQFNCLMPRCTEHRLFHMHAKGSTDQDKVKADAQKTFHVSRIYKPRILAYISKNCTNKFVAIKKQILPSLYY